MPIQNPFNSHFSQPPSHTEAPKKSGNLRSRIFKNKLILGGLGLFLLAGGLVSALYLSKSSQDIRQQATVEDSLPTMSIDAWNCFPIENRCQFVLTIDTASQPLQPWGFQHARYLGNNCLTEPYDVNEYIEPTLVNSINYFYTDFQSDLLYSSKVRAKFTNSDNWGPWSNCTNFSYTTIDPRCNANFLSILPTSGETVIHPGDEVEIKVKNNDPLVHVSLLSTHGLTDIRYQGVEGSNGYTWRWLAQASNLIGDSSVIFNGYTPEAEHLEPSERESYRCSQRHLITIVEPSSAPTALPLPPEVESSLSIDHMSRIVTFQVKPKAELTGNRSYPWKVQLFVHGVKDCVGDPINLLVDRMIEDALPSKDSTFSRPIMMPDDKKTYSMKARASDGISWSNWTSCQNFEVNSCLINSGRELDCSCDTNAQCSSGYCHPDTHTCVIAPTIDPNALNCNSITVSNSCPEPNTNITITQSATNANRYRIGWRWENGTFSSFTQGLATQTFRVPNQEGNLQLASNVCSTSNAEVCTYDGKLYEANYLCDPITSSSLGTCSGCSTWITACKKPTRPTNTQFSITFGDPSINAASAMRFSWDASANADGYRIYRTVTIDGQAQERLMGTTTSTQLMIVGRDTSLCTNFEASTCRIEAYRTCGGYCNNLEKTIDSVNFICTCSQAYATAAPTPTLTPAPTLAMTLTDKPLQGPQCASIQMYLNNDVVLSNQLNSIPVGSTVKFKCSSNIFIPVVDSYKFRVIYNSQITELLPIATDPHFSENYQIPANQAGNYSAQCTVCRDDQCQAWEAF